MMEDKTASLKEVCLRRPVVAVAALLALVSCGKADNPPAIQWVRTFSALDYAKGYWVEPTADGGFVAAGATATNGEASVFYLVKVDSQGGLEWERTFGRDGAQCVRQTRDGGYIIAGEGSRCFPGSGNEVTQPYVVKTDASGLLQWQRVYFYDTLEYGYCITETRDGGYALLASNPGYDSGMAVFRLDSAGGVVWRRSYPGTGYWDETRSIEQTPDSGFIVGYSSLVSLNATGEAIWSVEHPGVGQATSAQPTADGGYVATGPGFPAPNPRCSSQVYLMKVNSLGQLQWCSKWGGSGADIGRSVRQTADKGFVVAADFRPFEDWERGTVLRSDSLGNHRWAVPLVTPKYSTAQSICLAHDGGFVVAGTTPDSATDGQRLTLWKLAPEGE